MNKTTKQKILSFQYKKTVEPWYNVIKFKGENKILCNGPFEIKNFNI